MYAYTHAWVCACVCVHVWAHTRHADGGQRTTFGLFSLSTRWSPGTESESSGLVANIFTCWATSLAHPISELMKWSSETCPEVTERKYTALLQVLIGWSVQTHAFWEPEEQARRKLNYTFLLFKRLSPHSHYGNVLILNVFCSVWIT